MDEHELRDKLASLLTECAELGITVPDDMPMDTYDHKMMAVHTLSGAIHAHKNGRPHWLFGPHPLEDSDGNAR